LTAAKPAALPIRVLFAGSPAIAVPALEALAAAGAAGEGFALAGLLTNPDSPRGRSGRPEPTDCAAALARIAPEIPALKPERLDGAARERIAALGADILASFAYGRIFGPRLLALFPLGGINVHPSLLPKYRGPTPIQAAILGMEAETGVTIQRLAAEMDSGDILAQEKMLLGGRETAQGLGEAAAQKGAAMLAALLREMAALAGTAPDAAAPAAAALAGLGRAQDHGAATYCPLISKGDGLIDWSMGAREIDARIRAYAPWPLCWTEHGGQRLFILKAEPLEPAPGGAPPAPPGTVLGKDANKGILVQTGDGVLAAGELQYRSKKALGWKAFLNGARNFMNERLG